MTLPYDELSPEEQLILVNALIDEVKDLRFKEIVHEYVIPTMTLEDMRSYLTDLEDDDYEPPRDLPK